MSDQTKNADQSGVDKALIAMLLRMSPEERLRANDNAFRTILELRDAYRRQKATDREKATCFLRPGSARWTYWLLLRGEDPMRTSWSTPWKLISGATPFE